MKTTIEKLAMGSILVVLLAQWLTPHKDDVTSTLSGGEALVLRVALHDFESRKPGVFENQKMSTPRQMDIAHYTITIWARGSNFYVAFDPNHVFTDGSTGWVTSDGFYETMVIDRKTLKHVVTLVGG